MSCPFRNQDRDPTASGRDVIPGRGRGCEARSSRPRPPFPASRFPLHAASYLLLDCHLDEVTHLLELTLESGRNLLDHHVLVVLQADRLERATHAPRVPDLTADLLDSYAPGLRKVLLICLGRPLPAVPNECPWHVLDSLPPRHRATRDGLRTIRKARRLHTALARDLLDRRQMLQAVHRRANHVVRIRGAEALREDVGDAGAFHDGAHRTARDDARARSRRLHPDLSGAVRTHDFVRDRCPGERNRHHLAAGSIDGLPNGLRHFVRLARREADFALTVAHRNERVEREATTTFYDLGDAVDRDHVLDEIAAFTTAALLATTATAVAAAASTALAAATAAVTTAARATAR